MNSDKFEALMREGEIYHKLKVPEDCWTVIRVDGRSFSSFTEKRYEKPFDPEFSRVMQSVTVRLMEKLGAIYGFVESDEISILLSHNTDLFGRSVEKLVSISAAIAAASFTYETQEMVEFDSRIWAHCSDDEEETIGKTTDYFRWRQADAERCCINGYTYWKLRQIEKLSARKATSEMHQQSKEWKLDRLEKLGIPYNSIPHDYRHGVGFTRNLSIKEGINLKTGDKTLSMRRMLTKLVEIPVGQDYSDFLVDLLRKDTENYQEGKPCLE